MNDVLDDRKLLAFETLRNSLTGECADRRLIVILESPYGANRVEANKLRNNMRYLNAAMLHSIGCGEVPLPSHKIFPGPLRDDIEGERRLGMNLGFRLWDIAEQVVVYSDLGLTSGMQQAVQRCEQVRMPFVIRGIGLLLAEAFNIDLTLSGE